MISKKVLASMAIAASMTFAASTQAASISLPTGASGFWSYTGPGTLIDLNGGDTQNDFTLGAPTMVQIIADDCCVEGDAFGLILDGVSTPWTVTDTSSSVWGPGLFHGAYVALLGAGLHTFSLEVTADCCGYGEMSWNVSAVPEPETYAMLLAGLGVLGFSLRRNQKTAA